MMPPHGFTPSGVLWAILRMNGGSGKNGWSLMVAMAMLTLMQLQITQIVQFSMTLFLQVIQFNMTLLLQMHMQMPLGPPLLLMC